MMARARCSIVEIPWWAAWRCCRTRFRREGRTRTRSWCSSTPSSAYMDSLMGLRLGSMGSLQSRCPCSSCCRRWPRDAPVAVFRASRDQETIPTISAKSLWPPSEESPPQLPLFQCCYNNVDFSFDIFLNLQNNIGQGVWGKSKPLSNVIVWDCLKELCKICSVVLRHVNLDSLAESRQGTAGLALTLHHIK